MLPTTPTRTCSWWDNWSIGFITVRWSVQSNILLKIIHLIIRSYHCGYTVSHPNCEVKHGWAQSVLRWGTTRESWVSNVFFVHLQFFFVEFFFFFKLIEQIFFYSPIFSFSARHTSQNHRSHHSITPWWIYRIPSELRSQAPLGPISTAVGDYAGILGVEFFFFFTFFFFGTLRTFLFLVSFPGPKSNACRTHLPTEK